MIRISILLITLVLAGCGSNDKSTTGSGSNTPPATSTARDAIDGFTGKTYVKAGEDAKSKIRKISAEENKDMNEVMNGK